MLKRRLEYLLEDLVSLFRIADTAGKQIVEVQPFPIHEVVDIAGIRHYEQQFNEILPKLC